jgi:hypothetical protein
MRKFLATILCASFVFAVTSCRVIDKLYGGDLNLKKVGQLWSDVPRMDGLGPSDMEMPFYVKVLMRTTLNNLYRLNKNGEDKTPATGDWAVFTTSKSPDDVRNFYTNDRMTSFGGWETSKTSTCVKGNDQGFAGIGCVYKKVSGNHGTGLLIVAALDEQKKDTNVFFVRVETDEQPAPTNQNAGPKPARGEIKPLNGSAPYGIEKRPMPAGLNLDELLPKQVGPYTRTLLEKSEQRGVTPSAIEVDGNSVYATYRSGSKEIFVEFAVSSNAVNAQATLDNASSEVIGGEFPTDPQVGSIATEPSYLKTNNDSGAFFAWTRGSYYFSVSAKGGEADLDAFMQAFRY